MAKSITSIIIKLLFIFQQLHVCMSEPNNLTGFSMDLIHRDSPESPYYDPSLSPTETLVNALRRSLDRMRRLNRNYSLQSAQTDVVPSVNGGDFLMKYSIGNPPVNAIGHMDTGSGLVWTQCHPCMRCVKQSPPLYKPSHSSTYHDVECGDPECDASPHAHCSEERKHCLYYLGYEDGTATWGRLAKETFTLASERGTSTRVPNVVFGCGYVTEGTTLYGYESGIIGLGRGPDSLVTQLHALAKGKFSYCLVPHFVQPKASRSRLNFGDYAEVSGVGVVHIPLQPNPFDHQSFYCVTLVGYNLGSTRYDFDSEDGNLFVESGTTETRLPVEIYNSLKSSMIKALSNLKTIKDPNGLFDLCFAASRRESLSYLPTVTFHLIGGDLSFGRHNMYLRTTPDTLCLAVLPAVDGAFAVLGSIAQTNFLVGYDTEKEQVSFKSTDCSQSS